MGAKAGISVGEYLRTSYPDLDREFRDGVLLERPLPDYLHGKVQGLLFAFFAALRKTLPLFPCVETRMKIREGLYLIPDVAVFYRTEPERVPEDPPLVVIEVLSLDDRLPEVRAKLEQYKAWGVPHVWLVDPHLRCLYAIEDELREVPSLRIPELGIAVTPAEIFE